MTKKTLKEECTNCNKIYLTSMVELQKSWVSHCPTCKAGITNEFTKAVNGAYAIFVKAGN
jgi:phage FluMu protein Com